VTAEVSLPADVAAKAEPLHCERFEARAEAVGVPDSEVTILRSSDPIHLTVTVPLPEKRLEFPIYPGAKDLPASISRFDEAAARRLAEAAPVDRLVAGAMRDGVGDGGKPFDRALISAAYLYNFTGDEKYLNIAERLLAALPKIWAKHYAEYERDPVRLISRGVVCSNTLRLGWRVGGTQRSPYQYGTGGNAVHGTMSSFAYAFDMVAPKLDPGVRKSVIEGFFLPAAIHSRNHYIGDGNQQATANTTTLWGGLMARNWPLVSFAYSSEHGIRGTLDWCFTDNGMHLRQKYQTYSTRPILWTAELLRALDLDIYEEYRDRLEKIVNCRPTRGAPFEDRYFWRFIVEHRLKKEQQ
jgi:hypothetical protein